MRLFYFMNFWITGNSLSLKTKSCHDANFVITSGNEVCQKQNIFILIKISLKF